MMKMTAGRKSAAAKNNRVPTSLRKELFCKHLLDGKMVV